MATDVPSPKLHPRDVMPWSSLDASLENVQARPMQLAVNAATGGRSGAVTVTLWVTLFVWPILSVTVSVT